MCANCGCGVAEDKHGDERNITWSEIEAAADANGMSPEQVVAADGSAAILTAPSAPGGRATRGPASLAPEVGRPVAPAFVSPAQRGPCWRRRPTGRGVTVDPPHALLKVLIVS